MKTIQIFAGIVFVLGLILVGTMGVDLTHSRAGFGMLALAFAGFLFALPGIRKNGFTGNRALIAGVVLGAGYFIWRSLTGGPLGFAVADVTLVIILLGSYLVCARSQASTLSLVIGGIGLACLANAGVVVMQLTSSSPSFVWREAFGDKPMATGFFGHYNYLAAFLNASVFLFLSLAFFAKRWSNRLVFGLIAASSVACLFASGSRGGWLSFIVGFGVWVVVGLLFLKSRKHPGFGLAAIVCFVTLIALVVTSFSVVQELTDRRAGIDVEVEDEKRERLEVDDGGRMYFQQMAFEIFQDSPVKGSGPRSFSYLALEHWDPEEHWNWNANPVFAHNEYLQTLADYGLVGFLIILVLLFGHAVAGAISIGFEDDESASFLAPLKMGALAGLAAMAAQCFFSFLIHVPACVMMAGILLAILGLKSGRKGRSGMVGAALVSCSLLLVAGGLGFLGWKFSRSYLLFEEAKSSLATHQSNEDGLKALDTLELAAELGYNPEIFESSGRFAMAMSTRALDVGDQKLAAKFANIALDHLQQALELNPHSSVGLVMLPHVYDSLGEFAKADAGYELAMEKLWIREPFLKPHLYAARSQYGRGMMASDQRKNLVALRHFRVAMARMKKRTEVLNYWMEIPEDKEFRLEMEARIAALEGELLFQEGDRVWKKARPRQPEVAYGLMLAAAERYRASAKLMEPNNSRWRAQWKQLQENLELFEAVRTKPAQLTENQIAKVINPDAGLDSKPATR
ncbi:O-antigen ligase family protein [Verrucomicrobiaceae bacterium 227]